jgi:K+-transporting ATPase c subunit
MSALHDQPRGALSIEALAKLEALRGLGEPGVNVLKLNFTLDKLPEK